MRETKTGLKMILALNRVIKSHCALDSKNSGQIPANPVWLCLCSALASALVWRQLDPTSCLLRESVAELRGKGLTLNRKSNFLHLLSGRSWGNYLLPALWATKWKLPCPLTYAPCVPGKLRMCMHTWWYVYTVHYMLYTLHIIAHLCYCLPRSWRR